MRSANNSASARLARTSAGVAKGKIAFPSTTSLQVKTKTAQPS